jgi:hypothetical protein
MHWSEIQFDPPSRVLRQFAGLWVVFFLGLAAWQGAVRDRTHLAYALAALALSVGPLGLFEPRFIRPVYVAWMVLAFPIGWVVSRLILGLLFFGIVTPVGLVLRLTGRDPLLLRPVRGADSYWRARSATHDVRRYFRQF